MLNSERHENNKRYFQGIQNQKSKKGYYNENTNFQPSINKLKNFKKLDKKNKCNSLDKINIDNTYSFKYDLTNYNNNLDNDDEDLDIELEAVSKKIPIDNIYFNNFYKEEKDNKDRNYELDYYESKTNFILQKNINKES